MKKNSSWPLVIVLLFFLVTTRNLSGQTTVDINQNMEHIQQNCVAPSNVDFYFSAITSHYTLSDSIDFHLDYGDGNFTNQRVAQNFYSSSEAFTSFNNGNYLTHTYLTQGIFMVTYIATLPDGNADTVIVPVMITTTCNNVTGRVYVDVNNNCTYDAGDEPAPVEMYLNYNGQMVYTDFTDSQGQFSLNALPGYTYSLVAGESTIAPLTWTCSTAQTMTISPVPNANQDFIIRDSTAMKLIISLDSTFGTCIPLYADLTAIGTTFSYSSPNDSISMFVDFGDSHDTVVMCPVYNNGGLFGNFWYTFSHIYTSLGSFTVTYIATAPDGLRDTIVRSNTCIAIDTCQINAIAVSENNIPELIVYPNPATTSLEVKLSGSIEATIILSDVLGNEIEKKQMNGTASTIDVAAIPDGIYFLTLTNSQEKIMRKIVVQH
jgi:hypothetical protein